MSEAKLAPNMPKWMVDHVDKYLSSGGKEGHMYTISLPNLPPREVPSLLLITTGRKSGQKFLFPLFYGKTGDSYYIVASKGGAPTNPDWYVNMTEAGTATVEVGTETYAVTVTELTGEERDRVYAEQARRYPGFAEYEQQTAGIRTIPVLALTRQA